MRIARLRQRWLSGLSRPTTKTAPCSRGESCGHRGDRDTPLRGSQWAVKDSNLQPWD